MSCLSGLVVFPTFFNLSLNLVLRSLWSEPQSGPGLVFAECIEIFHLWLQRIYNKSDFGIEQLVMSMHRVFLCGWKSVFAMTRDIWPVQQTLKNLLQHHSSKASILQRPAFFIVQCSHPYMTTGKTTALTRRTFVGKVMSLLLYCLGWS